MKAPALLLDTNVWVDLQLPGENSDDVRSFFHAAWRHEARLGIAAHSLKDVFTIIERRIKQLENNERKMDPEHAGPAARAAAWAAVGHIIERAEVVGSDYMDAHLAVKDRVFHDFYEDNLVVSAARRMEADLLVTSDRSLLKHAPVASLTPARAVEWMEARV